MSEHKETISFYRDKTALAKVGRSEHIVNYDCVSDIVDEDGTRTIVIKPADRLEILKKAKELAEVMVERLGEGHNKLLQTMLFDTLRDYPDKEIEQMHKKVTRGKEPVKHKEGCFKIIIGDGRKRNSHHIMLIQ